MTMLDEVAAMSTHAFGKSKPYSLGVEEEFQLVDPASFGLVQRVDSLLEHASEDDLAQIKPELMQSVIGDPGGRQRQKRAPAQLHKHAPCNGRLCHGTERPEGLRDEAFA